MKRASYCANADFYTVAGTQIVIGDEANQVTPDGIEAWWTPQGASCVDRDHMRQPRLGTAFNGICNGTLLPTCKVPPGNPAQKRWLIDGPAQP